jgi:hypothetical protein
MGQVALVIATITFCLVAEAAPRSRAVRAEFVRQVACPATGQHRLPCPGYHIDHREALVCGGRDEVSNLQWLPVAEHRDKTRVEVKLCRARTRADPATPAN